MMWDIAAERDAVELLQSWYKEYAMQARFVYDMFDDAIYDTDSDDPETPIVDINTKNSHKILCDKLNALEAGIETAVEIAAALQEENHKLKLTIAEGLRDAWAAHVASREPKDE